MLLDGPLPFCSAPSFCRLKAEPLPPQEELPADYSLEQAREDSYESHKAALRYADQELGRLLEGWKRQRGGAFVICCSDHGTCYGEDGCQFHGINHPVVNTVPYKHFFL